VRRPLPCSRMVLNTARPAPVSITPTQLPGCWAPFSPCLHVASPAPDTPPRCFVLRSIKPRTDAFLRHSRLTRALADRPPHRTNLPIDEPDLGGCPPPCPRATPSPLGPTETTTFPIVPHRGEQCHCGGFFIDSSALVTPWPPSLLLKKPWCVASLTDLFFSAGDHRSCPAARCHSTHRPPPPPRWCHATSVRPITPPLAWRMLRGPLLLVPTTSVTAQRTAPARASWATEAMAARPLCHFGPAR
jgi:hypothetical protein